MSPKESLPFFVFPRIDHFRLKKEKMREKKNHSMTFARMSTRRNNKRFVKIYNVHKIHPAMLQSQNYWVPSLQTKKCWQICCWIYITLLYKIENMAKVLACTSVNRVFKIIAWVLEFLWRWVLLVLESSSTQEPLYIRASVFYLYLRKTGSSST